MNTQSNYKDVNNLDLESNTEEQVNNVKEQLNNIESIKITNEIPFIEFNNTDNSVDTISDTIDNINLDENGPNFIYNIIRYFNDLYVSGRTHIENNYFNFASNEDFNLVYPNIYVGNYSITTNIDLLKGLGITHIISVIPVFNPAFEDKFKYLHIQAHDDENQDIKKYVEISNEFIKNCIFEGGKVLIHCMVGRSRSVTIFIAFLIMIIKGEFTQSLVTLDNDKNNYLNNYNELSNMIEYKKLIENNENNTHIIQNNKKYRRNNTNNSNHLNQNSYIDIEQITSITQELPKLSKKEENFIIYKKQKMCTDIEDIICNYNLLKKELNSFKKTTFVETEETLELFENMKAQFASKIFIQLLTYVRSHRECASPNNNFINQLCKLIF